ncbi:ATP-binding protein [Vibrio aquimaris]|uniref:histidine kinase n=1 Tax=Vibrio aquimaris TaxID=2587862 RepID=A0A5P9CRY6_9VIBR|nr:ATP-binding protein [Vibrio aquimaris]QFT28442.1 Autoinducer 2 sensor kinase/phosphatase LuxQ [Vibrio aquimaris]
MSESFWERGRHFVAIISALCLVLVAVIVYVFFSVSKIKEVTPEPYVTIINNNITAKTKLLTVKAAILTYTSHRDKKHLAQLKFKSKVFRASIYHDLLAERTLDLHSDYGDVNELKQINDQIAQAFDGIDKLTLGDIQSAQSVIVLFDRSYKRLNAYLAGFVNSVQHRQAEFLDFKESFYNKQYVYLGIILLCSMLMIGVISWMYLNQIRLGKALENKTKIMEEAKKNAEQSASAKARFLANMSHEMRTPLNAIIGLSQKEYYRSLDEQTRHFIAMINSSGEHLLKLINNVLDLSKIEKGRSAISYGDFYISELIDVSKTVFVNFDKQRDVEVFYSTGLTSNYKIRSDKTKLVQIINNLGYNALKFTEKGFVDLSISIVKQEDQTQLNICVKDSGIGMTQEQLDKVFQEFTQADESITRKYGGTGLGLSICQSLVSMFGGRIQVSSELGQGSEFVVNIPTQIIEEKPLLNPLWEKKSVQVIASHQGVRSLIIRELDALGLYDPQGSTLLYYLSNGEQLGDQLNQFAETKPDSILVYGHLNTTMPLLDNTRLLSKPYNLLNLIDHLQEEVMLSVSTSDSNNNNAEAQPEQRKISVMLVEDIRMNQIVAEKMLSTLSAETTTVNNGQECLDVLRQQSFDIIFMDIQMPVMDGLEAVKRIKSEGLAPNTPIIALTANTFDNDVEQYLEQGFSNVLGKPFKLEWLKGILDKHAHHRG